MSKFGATILWALLLAVTPARGEDYLKNLPDIEAREFTVTVQRISTSGRVTLFDVIRDEPLKAGTIVLIRENEAPVMAFRVLKVYPEKSQFAGRKVREYPKSPTLQKEASFGAIEKIQDIFPVPITPEQASQDAIDIKELETAPSADDVESLLDGTDDLGSVEKAPPAEEPTSTLEKPEAIDPSAIDATELDPKALPSTEDSLDDGLLDTNDLGLDLLAEGGDEADEILGDLENTESVTAELDPNDPNLEPLPKVQKYDPVLDAGTSPTPLESLKDAAPDESGRFADFQDGTNEFVLEEYRRIDRDKHWLSVGIGYFRNAKTGGDSGYYTGLGLKYGVNLDYGLWLNSNQLQDSLVVEFAAGSYRISNYSGEGSSDSYTIAPLGATLRYNLHTNSGFVPFAYAGLTKNFILANTEGTAIALSELSQISGAFGIGILSQLGPRWFLRFDLGFDLIGGGLMLRF